MPSCELHNSAKSDDDEYLRFVLTTTIFENAYKNKLFETKVIRAIDRKPHVYTEFISNLEPIIVRDVNGNFSETAAYKVDLNRFNSAIHHIACGIYFFHTSRKWFRKSVIINNAMMNFSEQAIEINGKNQKLCNEISSKFNTIEALGDNPEIFQYKIQSNNNDQHAIFMIFYGAIEITAVLL
ncbi:hypothetical protein [Paraglaciecola hydrolytica]|uniref:Uncharacterized protein n=1 Tax=Paraglaciecola hydrolytica TaxID=1799789 RepID=A0A136A1C6_9ALTE|nr:hypothetical protein [Paraglaciecola hydrolytica]KXI29024.1 hypothetical protein AX660_12710 [Paraglaciecola hydrolytica]